MLRRYVSPPSSRFETSDAAALAVLLVAGAVYFGLYYDHGFNLADEGSVLLLTQRLMEGERPFLDISLGYGLLWYYPLVLLFEITGVHFIASRIFFLALAMVTASLAFLIIQRHTGRRGLAIALASIIVLVPGTLHKTFIPLIVVANMAALPILEADRGYGRLRVFVAGLVAAISSHIRPDLGFCVVVVLIATLAAHTIPLPMTWPKRVCELSKLALVLALAALVPTIPLVVLAYRQGFLEPFLGMFFNPIIYFAQLAEGLAQTPAGPSEMTEQIGMTWPRAPLAAIWEGGPQRGMAILTYAPILALAMIGLFACFLLVRKRPRTASVRGEAVGMIALSGLAYSAFPQFFLFRPDVQHLSQFMPGYLVLSGILLDIAAKSSRWRWGRIAAAVALISYAGFYAWFGLRHPGAGSIALAMGRDERFVAANGIDVAVTEQEKRLFTAATRIIEEHTKEDDWVLCFPYCPGFNVMTNRRSFLRYLYVDDSLLLLEPDWQQRMIDRIKAEEPAMIIIQDWAVNTTDISRFQNWAAQVMEHVASEYFMLRRVGTFKFYVRQGDGSQQAR